MFLSCCQFVCADQVKLPEFNVSSVVVNLLYFQSLVWAAIPIYPLGGFVGAIFLFCNFKYDLLVLSVYNSKPTRTYSAKDTGTFFTLFYSTTVFLLCVLGVYFLNSPFPCAKGPWSSSGIPWDLVVSTVSSLNLSLVRP